MMATDTINQLQLPYLAHSHITNTIGTLKVNEAPQNSSLVRNRKAAERRGDRAAKELDACRDFADQMQMLLSLSQTDDFIRCVIIFKSRVPSILLYTDRQICEVKAFCFNRAEGSRSWF